MDIESSAASSFRIARPIDPAVGRRLLDQKNAYARLIELEQSKYQLNKQFYLISSEFLRDWKHWVRYQDKAAIPIEGIEPNEYNVDITQVTPMGTYQLKDDLSEKQDFEIVSKDIMDIFAAYSGRKITKKTVKAVNGQIKVEVYPLRFKYFVISQKVCYDMDYKKVESMILLDSKISRYATPDEFRELGTQLYQSQFKVPKQKELVRIWKLQDITFDKYRQHVKRTIVSQQHNRYLIEPKAQIFEREGSSVEQFGISDTDVIMIEVKERSSGWVIKYGDYEQSCHYCRNYKILKFPCKCQKAFYCSEECKFKDQRIHRNYCSMADEQQLKDLKFDFTDNSRKGLTGLCNLGNTCFMNSCLQCLSHTVPLTKYFLSGKFKDEINTTNKIGTKGKLTTRYASTMRGLWVDSDDVYSPYAIKSAVGEFQPMFSGYAQHDSQQFLSYLLDGLHEDLNRVKEKPNTQSIDSKGRPDEVVAKQSWLNYQLRNKSVIVDLFMGQFKSKVTCPDCGYESITFDPYLTLSLPIPQSKLESIDCFLFYANYSSSPKKLTVEFREGTIQTGRENIAARLNLQPNSLKFYVLTFDAETKFYGDNSSLKQMKDEVEVQRKSLFCVELTPQQMQIPEEHRKQLNFKFVKFNKQFMVVSKKQTCTFKRPFFFKVDKTLSGKHLYQRILDFLRKPVLEKVTTSVPQKANGSTLSDFFELYLMTNLTKEVKYREETWVFKDEKLIDLEDDIGEYLSSFKSEFQIQVRMNKTFKDEMRKLNTYDDFDKHTRRGSDEDDGATYDIIDCIKEFKKKQRLDKDNSWYCSRCKDHKEALKEMNIYKTPKILIIHLKRFKQKSYFKSKLANLITSPPVLDLTDYVIDKNLPEEYYLDAKSEPKPLKYKLYAVSNHYGGLGGGHYTAYAKNGEQWYEFNDSSVRSISGVDSAVTKGAYMLFYQRVD